MGTSGPIVQAQSREEIYADKLLGFALRPTRLKHRDLWDMVWLHQQTIQPSIELIPNKLHDRRLTQAQFFELFDKRQKLLAEDKKLPIEFNKEMPRFLPSELMDKALTHDNLWSFIVYLIGDLGARMHG